MRQNTRTSASTVANTLALLGMGGTIAGTGSASGVGYQAGQIAAQDLLGGIAVPTGCVVRPQQVRQLDSKDIGDGDWLALAQACGQQLADPQVAAVVITHGTDTLEETAWFLQCVLPAGKPVVLTCAMRPASALSADGPANLRDALVCAVDEGALAWAQAGQPVLVVAAGEVHSAAAVRKAHAYQVHALSSAPAGPVAWVEEGRLRWAQRLPQQVVVKNAVPLPPLPWPWVEVVTSHAGARAEGVDALVAAGVRGLVVAGTGNGTVHAAWLPALQRARAAGVPIVRTTRCVEGRIVQAPGQDDAEVVDLPPLKARISLMLRCMLPSVPGPSP